mgnify:FL=1
MQERKNKEREKVAITGRYVRSYGKAPGDLPLKNCNIHVINVRMMADAPTTGIDLLVDESVLSSVIHCKQRRKSERDKI